MSRSLTKARSVAGAQESRAEHAWMSLANGLRSTPAAQRVSPNIDLQDAGMAIVSLVEREVTDPIRVRMKALASVNEFRYETVGELEELAWAGIHVRRKLLMSLANVSEAKLPATLVQEAQTLRGRMLKVVEYHLEDNAEYAGTIAHIREGAGHLDLANDLEALADMYRDAHTQLKADTRRFNASDEATARSTAEKIYRELRSDTASLREEEDWTTQQAALWPRLQRAYNEVRRVMRFLLSLEDDTRFPSLVTAARGSQQSAPRKEEEPSPPKPAG